MAALLRAGRDHDGTRLMEIATASGMVRGEEVNSQALLELVDPLLEPLRQEEFTFTRSWLRCQTMRFSDPRSPVSHPSKLQIPVRYLLV